MVSLRLLIIVLWTSSLLEITQGVDSPSPQTESKAESTCLRWEWEGTGDGPIQNLTGYEWEMVTFPSSLCSATSIIYEDASRTIRIERELTEQYECEPAGFWQGLPGFRQPQTRIKCFCKASTDSPCNLPELMFDPEGDEGQKNGIIAVGKTTHVGRRIDLQYFACENWHVMMVSIVDAVQNFKTSKPCKGTCVSRITRKEAEKGVDVGSSCWGHIVDQRCTPKDDANGKTMVCFCAGSDCNTAARLFDPEGYAGQKSRALELRKIGIIDEVTMIGSKREIVYKFDENFGKTVIRPTEATTAVGVEATTTVPDGPSGAGGDDAPGTDPDTISPEEAADDAGDPDDDVDEDSATGLSLTLAVVLTILRLI